MSSIESLSQSAVWKHFAKICSIPHISKHEEKLVEHIRCFAKTLNLDFSQDSAGNILIRKSASKGYEHASPVILQAHLDMVPQKNEGINHDFLVDSIKPYIDDNWVKAHSTTLGADNGIGVAYILSILESDTVKHGPLEALFTIDEEAGMSGALGIKAGFLKGKKLINLDTEDDDELIIGCAGGKDCIATMNYSEEQLDNTYTPFSITVKGLKGGHSGIDINLGRANAIKLLFRVLYTCTIKTDLRIISINGGNIRNAIPREATASIMIPVKQKDTLLSLISELSKTFNHEYAGVENIISVLTTELQGNRPVLSLQTQRSLLMSIYSCPNGVIRMSNQVRDFVETSSNLGILDCANGKISVNCLLRSSVESSMTDLQNAIYCALTAGNFDVIFTGGYPGWAPDQSSALLATLSKVYEKEYGKKADIKAVHAGLECGIIGAQYPDMELISCGPTIKFPHSPDECVSISSVNKFWSFLLKVLEEV